VAQKKRKHRITQIDADLLKTEHRFSFIPDAQSNHPAKFLVQEKALALCEICYYTVAE
jgi:hypothetical protein